KWVNTAAFSADGRRIVTASVDRTARVWDAATGKPLLEPLRHDQPVEAAAFSPDGLLLLTVSDQTVRLWDTTMGRSVAIFQLDAPVTKAAFSPDGRQLLLSGGKTLQVWDAASAESFPRLLPPVAQAASLPRYEVSGRGREVQLKDGRTGQALG